VGEELTPRGTCYSVAGQAMIVSPDVYGFTAVRTEAAGRTELSLLRWLHR
jgi:hypothetical protein